MCLHTALSTWSAIVRGLEAPPWLPAGPQMCRTFLQGKQTPKDRPSRSEADLPCGGSRLTDPPLLWCPGGAESGSPCGHLKGLLVVCRFSLKAPPIWLKSQTRPRQQRPPASVGGHPYEQRGGRAAHGTWHRPDRNATREGGDKLLGVRKENPQPHHAEAFLV